MKMFTRPVLAWNSTILSSGLSKLSTGQALLPPNERRALPGFRGFLLRLILGMFLLGGWQPARAALEVMPAGSYIINMSVEPQTVANGLKPYGLVYTLLRDYQVPIKWVIKPNKAKNRADFTYNGVSYRGAPFVIPGNFAFGAVETAITDWAATYRMNIVETTSPITAPVYTTITYPTWTLDDANGGIAKGYIINAAIPESAYNWKNPQGLGCCDQFFAMPHADPVWSTHSNLFYWDQSCDGGIWSTCQAVSA